MSAKYSQSVGRLRLRHLLETTEAKGEEMAEQRERFARLASDDAKPRVVSAFNLFQTPEPLAARVAGMFTTFGRTLEPSAGLGRLYRAVRSINQNAEIVLVDQSPDCARELYLATTNDANAKLVQADFLACDRSKLGAFDSIIMNPPFKMRTDVKHIKHAMTLLAPGGKLVSICANGPKQRSALIPLASAWIELPAGEFKTEGTSVATAIFVFDSV